ncbi:hypothetical protein JI739_07100 [Ramlibacter sp. AW1]|uniref:Fibronectin type-III domain-containing protein n=1 Tax=Ramlibacter aurantiacus TaxID=2801330 RepID=A0A937D496_9BURK|nr:hypothetical protein [Ramlibacter aurantiacus]MBL0420112.1 hypothetical protein [Ramlibacter aurantiacus]
MSPQPLSRVIAPALLTILLTACGGGAGGGDTGLASESLAGAPATDGATSSSSSSSTTPSDSGDAATAAAGSSGTPAPASTASASASADAGPAAPTKLTAVADRKRYELAWPAAEGATSYQVLFVPDGARTQPPEVIAEVPATQLNVSIPVPLDWYQLDNRAQFSVRSCAKGRCGNASPITPAYAITASFMFKGGQVQAGSEFGYAVALSADGDTLAAAAPKWKNQDKPGFGRVSIYRREASGWVEHFVDDISTQTNQYGLSVALSADGRTLAIGVPGEGDGGTVMVCHLKASYVCDQIRERQNGQSGLSVSLSGDGRLLAIGAPNLGAVVVMATPDDGSAPTHLRTVSSGTEGFGAQVALSSDGKTLVATDHLPGEDLRTNHTVFVTHDADGDWSLGPAKPEPLFTTGTTIAVSADGARIAIGVSHDMQVQVFERQGNDYALGAVLTASRASPQNDLFGASVALSGDGKTLAVGALNPLRGRVSNPRSGSIHLFALGQGGWTSRTVPQPGWGIRGIGAVPLGSQLYLPNIALSLDGKSLAIGDVGEMSPSPGYLGWPGEKKDSGPSYGAVHLF